MKLILMRHGETVENAKGLSQGHFNSQLTQKGIEQAQKAALRLKNEKIDFAYSSDLDRAKDTLKEILAFHPKTKSILTRDLREQAKGIYERKPSSAKYKELEKQGVPYYEFKPEGGERLLDVWYKTTAFIEKIKKEHVNNSVLIVSHGGTLACLLTYLHGKTIENYREYIPRKNTAITIIELDKNISKVITLNCTKHMSDMKD